MILPTYGEIDAKVEDGFLLNPLEQFIYDNEPAGEYDEHAFREGLAAAIEWVEDMAR
jgi:hypothetical protein